MRRDDELYPDGTRRLPIELGNGLTIERTYIKSNGERCVVVSVRLDDLPPEAWTSSDGPQ